MFQNEVYLCTSFGDILVKVISVIDLVMLLASKQVVPRRITTSHVVEISELFLGIVSLSWGKIAFIT